MFRKTYVEIDLGAIRNNLLEIRRYTGSRVKMLLPVKADAYGHGIVEVSRYVQEQSLVHVLGVASIDEGIEIRNSGVTLPILVLGLILSARDEIDALIDYDLSQTVASFESAANISAVAEERNASVNLHLKVDTGMGRIGCAPDDSAPIAQKISGLGHVNLEGIYTHMPVSDIKSSEFTSSQIRQFSDIIGDIKKKGLNIGFCHMANSAGVLNFPESYYDMIRPGLISYGYSPFPGNSLPIKLVPAMTMKSCIIALKRVKSGTPLSYGHIYKTGADTNIATIAAGYGDGYSRSLSNKGMVTIEGKTYPLVGRVCMDQILADLGNDTYPPGAEVTLFGKGSITAETIASLINTIPYEITCGISKRVPRVYLK